jgi:hypothetical protein
MSSKAELVRQVEDNDLTWRRSRRSDNSGPYCVEVAELEGGVALRDSKDKAGPVLTFTQAEWEAFIAGAKDGEFDLA